jgi:hypothetical protein
MEPIRQLLKNPHVDAGTLLQLFWHADPEDYYLGEVDYSFGKEYFEALKQIERRFVKGDYKTASFPFDPTNRVSMGDRRSEFARPIPDVMYQPIPGRKPATKRTP